MKRARPLIYFLGGLAVAGTGMLAIEKFGVFHSHAADSPEIKVQTQPLQRDAKITTSFAPVVKRVGSSVVTIYSTKTVRQNLNMNPMFNDPMLRRFFGLPEEEEDEGAPGNRGGRRPPQQREHKEQSLGSGVIVSADGYILSNNHVVEGADEVKVAFSGSEDEAIAKVIGTDPQTDISVLKIERKGLNPITITDSDNLQVGDVVLAIGNPFGVGQTVTMGIVSATGRGGMRILGSGGYEDFIQTDASINPGNSGGALVDAEGRLVGINTAIFSRTGGSMGIGFAVPVNLARGVMESIIRDGKVTRGYLGVIIGDVSPRLAEKFELKSRAGALVSDVPRGTPAAEVGLQPGDVIIEFNGRKVPDSRQLRLWVSQTAPKTKSKLKIIRDGEEKTINITLGELPTDQVASVPGGKGRSPAQPSSDTLDGVEITDIDQRSRRQFDIPSNIRGALVTSVDPDSTAAAAGLRPGDVILEMERQKVQDAQEAIDMSNKLKSDEPILLRVWSSGGRGGLAGTRFIVVEPTKQRK